METKYPPWHTGYNNCPLCDQTLQLSNGGVRAAAGILFCHECIYKLFPGRTESKTVPWEIVKTEHFKYISRYTGYYGPNFIAKPMGLIELILIGQIDSSRKIWSGFGYVEPKEQLRILQRYERNLALT